MGKAWPFREESKPSRNLHRKIAALNRNKTNEKNYRLQTTSSNILLLADPSVLTAWTKQESMAT